MLHTRTYVLDKLNLVIFLTRFETLYYDKHFQLLQNAIWCENSDKLSCFYKL